MRRLGRLAAVLAASVAFAAWGRWAGYNEGWGDGWTAGVFEDEDDWVT